MAMNRLTTKEEYLDALSYDVHVEFVTCPKMKEIALL
jgi:hypothetical protein